MRLARGPARVAGAGTRRRSSRSRRARGEARGGARSRASRFHALGAGDECVRARAVCRSRGRSRRDLVGARVALPGGHSARRTQCAGLGREDSHRSLAGLLPHVSLRSHRRAPADGCARIGGGRDRRSPRGGRDAAREAVRSGPVGPLGSARRAGLRFAALRRVARARGREGGLERRRSARHRGHGGRGGAEDELHRALLRSRVRVCVHAGDRAHPRGHERRGVRCARRSCSRWCGGHGRRTRG